MSGGLAVTVDEGGVVILTLPDGQTVTVTLVTARRQQARLRVQAPAEVKINRGAK